MRSFRNFDEDLRNWFSKSHPDGGWKRVNTKGEVVGDCARDDKDGDGKGDGPNLNVCQLRQEQNFLKKRKHPPQRQSVNTIQILTAKVIRYSFHQLKKAVRD